MKNLIIKSLLMLSSSIALISATVSCAVLANSKPFTVQGELPANTGITFLATYYPENDQSSACSYRDLASGSSEIRGGTVGTEVPIKAEAQHYQVSIPTQNYIRRCKVILTGVSVEVANTDNNDHQTDNTGFIGIVDKTPLPPTETHPAHFSMSCDWSFKLYPRPSRYNDILKMMNCTFDKNQYVSRNMALSDLINQSMVLNVTFNKEEKPSVETSWKKVEGGWMPCKGSYDGMAGYCKTPPEFIKFKYQGKTCSVYPTCTE